MQGQYTGTFSSTVHALERCVNKLASKLTLRVWETAQTLTRQGVWPV